jgi:hypothetical protein
MAQYTLTKINDKLWREFKSECARQGVTIRAFLIKEISRFVVHAYNIKKLKKKEGK